MNMQLTDVVTTVPGIGSIMAGKLGKLGVETAWDLLYHIPSRYEDRRIISKIKDVKIGETVTIVGTLEKLDLGFTKTGKNLQTAKIADDTGTLTIIWFNQMFLKRVLKVGEKYAFYGKVDWFAHKIAIVSPEYGDPDSAGQIVPIYPETAGVSSKWLRGKILPLLDIFPNFKAVHAPEDLEAVPTAKRKLALDELIILQLRTLLHKKQRVNIKLTHPLVLHKEKVQEFINSLPFKLTNSQQHVINEVLLDLADTKPMNRLLEGEVGSGKTVIAAIAAYIASLNNLQTILLAPTQILARQHYETLKSLLKVEVGLVTSQVQISNFKFQILVGTHALLNNKLDNVGLVIIDEQHKFGVAQRKLAIEKGSSPHVLTMTATPIPRTLALTIYGDLDLSVLTEMPHGRLAVKTWVVGEEKRDAAYTWIKKQNTQVFVVCPLIEESETLQSIKSVKLEFERLKTILSPLKLGLLHGKLKAAEKDNVIADFKNKKIDVLVSTPVVEVGIDIPGANIMLIEAAHRFGLSQLHQLRGRVGRSSAQAYCLLFTDIDSDRLKAMEKYNSGFELAEIDLKLRGVGNIFGTSQHGYLKMKVADFTDAELVKESRVQAEKILPDLANNPTLQALVEQDKMSQSYDTTN